MALAVGVAVTVTGVAKVGKAEQVVSIVRAESIIILI